MDIPTYKVGLCRWLPINISRGSFSAESVYKGNYDEQDDLDRTGCCWRRTSHDGCILSAGRKMPHAPLSVNCVNALAVWITRYCAQLLPLQLGGGFK